VKKAPIITAGAFFYFPPKPEKSYSLTRAKVNTSTLFAPLPMSIRAHSFTVVPVVNTSSTKIIFFPDIFRGFLTRKASRRLLRLSLPLKPV